jgi:PqqD family protein of HPr-rel-A system
MPAIKPKIRGDLAVVELDGEAVIYNDDDGSLHHLNPTATIVLSCCDGTATIKEFSADLAEAFSVPADELERQVRALLRDFRKKGLLEGSKAAASKELADA